MGRPPKPKAERRTKTIRFLATVKEKELLEAAADTENLELSAWMRSVLLSRAEALREE